MGRDTEDCSEYDAVYDNFLSKYSKALDEGDLSELLKLKYFVEDLGSMKRPKLYERISSSSVYKNSAESVEKLRAEWMQALKQNDVVDIYFDIEGKWFETKILEIDLKDGTFKVHYQGWNSNFDEVLAIGTKRMCAKNTYTIPKKKPKKSKIEKPAQPLVEKVESVVTISTIDSVSAAAVEEVSELPGERSSRRRSRGATSAATAPVGTKRDREEGNGDAERDGRRKTEKEEVDRNDWVCTVCGWFEAPDGSDLVCCDALCKRSFHLGCMRGKMRAPVGDTAWYCDDCVAGQHLCFLCGQRGVDCEDVHKCNVAHCGKFYHRACLESRADQLILPQFKVLKKKELLGVVSAALPHPPAAAAALGSPKRNKAKGGSAGVPSSPAAATPRSTRGVRLDYRSLNSAGDVVSPNKKSGDDEAGLSPAPLLQQDPNVCYSLQRTERTDVLSFKCPMHTCYNCFEFYGNADTAELTKCLLCPRAFHTNCILPGSRFNSMCLLCPLHPDAPLPSHDVRLHPKAKKNGSGAGNECSLFWEQLAIPDEMPNAADPFDNHFKLQNHIKNDSESMAQNFIKIGRNDYDTFPEGKSLQGFVPEVACECKVDCGEDCLNRVLRIECCDSKIRSAGGSGDMCICAIGTGCTNRALQNRKYAKTEPFREFQMGWGLRAKERIAEGALVMEYVGEVIDHAEVQRRMSAQRINTPQDKDFYIMELDNGVFVDGKFKGSTSRYINHSCDPNCELQRWVVKGSPRIGIFAIRDIADGEALSYDYQFDTNEAEAFKCYCGTDKCRGTMAPKKKKISLFDANGRPVSKEERDRLILMGRQLEQSRTVESQIEEEWARSYTGRMIPGDPINEMRNGPVKATLASAREASLLLVRTVRGGTNFFQRNELLVRRAAAFERRYRQKKATSVRGKSGAASVSASSSPRGRRGRPVAVVGEDSQGSSEQGELRMEE